MIVAGESVTDQERLRRAQAQVMAARQGRVPKRKPVKVMDLGGGNYGVVDGNTTFHNLKALGEKEVLVEVVSRGGIGQRSSYGDQQSKTYVPADLVFMNSRYKQMAIFPFRRRRYYVCSISGA